MPKFPTTLEIPVRFSDTDAMGHANNARYFHYMEEGRAAYFKSLFPDRDPGDAFALFPFILADARCTFKSPAYFGEILLVSLGVTETGNSSFVIEYEITAESDGRVVALGRTVQVCYDYIGKKSVPIPDEMKTRFRDRETRGT